MKFRVRIERDEDGFFVAEVPSLPGCVSQGKTREEAIRVLKRHEGDLRARGVTHLALFGSLARGEAGPDSDVDVVVDIEPGRKFSIIDHGSLRVMLCDIFGRETDVVVRSRLRPRSRQGIANESLLVF